MSHAVQRGFTSKLKCRPNMPQVQAGRNPIKGRIRWGSPEGVMFIGEGPGKQEDCGSLLSVGPANSDKDHRTGMGYPISRIYREPGQVQADSRYENAADRPPDPERWQPAPLSHETDPYHTAESNRGLGSLLRNFFWYQRRITSCG